VWFLLDPRLGSTLPEEHKYKMVALKIQKSASQYTDAALDEIEILGAIKKRGEDLHLRENFVVSLIDHFFIYGPNGKRK